MIGSKETVYTLADFVIFFSEFSELLRFSDVLCNIVVDMSVGMSEKKLYLIM